MINENECVKMGLSMEDMYRIAAACDSVALTMTASADGIEDLKESLALHEISIKMRRAAKEIQDRKSVV